jgi:hypothetical protein
MFPSTSIQNPMSTHTAGGDPEKLQSVPSLSLQSPSEEPERTAPPSPSLTATDRVRTNNTGKYGSSHSMRSASRARTESHRKGDDLELMKAERVASQTSDRPEDIYRSATGGKSTLLPPEPLVNDSMDDVANPVHNTRKAWKPPKQPATKLAKLLKRVLFFFFIYCSGKRGI